MHRFFRAAGSGWALSVCLLVLSATFMGATARTSSTSRGAGDKSAHQAAPDGQQIYMTRCMACHNMEGEGMPGMFPPLDGTEWVTGDKERLIRIVLNGLSGEIEVHGDVYGGEMPGWRALLNDDEIAAVLTYIRSEWSNDASPVAADEVAEVRKATGDRERPWTAAELEKVIP